jgi:hypothetical protein
MTTMTHAHTHPHGPSSRWWQVVFPILRTKVSVDTLGVAEQAAAARARTDVHATDLRRAMAATLAEVDRRAREGLRD